MDNIILMVTIEERLIRMESNLSKQIDNRIISLSSNTNNISTQLNNLDNKYTDIYIRDFTNSIIQASNASNSTNFNFVNKGYAHSQVFKDGSEFTSTITYPYTKKIFEFSTIMSGNFYFYANVHFWGIKSNTTKLFLKKNGEIIANSVNSHAGSQEDYIITDISNDTPLLVSNVNEKDVFSLEFVFTNNPVNYSNFSAIYSDLYSQYIISRYKNNVFYPLSK